MKVLNYGSLNIDHVYAVKEFPQPGETIDSICYETFLGGKGLNQSIALQRSGIPVFHAGAIGKDGMTLKEVLEINGVDTRYIRICDSQTGHALIQVNETGENCIILYHGANKSIMKEDIDKVFRDFNENDILILQNEINNLEYILEIATLKHMMIIFNPAPFTKDILTMPLDNISYMILNESEAMGLSGCINSKDAMDILKNRYPGISFIITLGEKGSCFFNKDKTFYQKAYSVPVHDTTGAGDTFIGYFIGCLVKELPLPECLDIAARASAIAITKKGASNAIPCIDEVMQYDFDK